MDILIEDFVNQKRNDTQQKAIKLVQETKQILTSKKMLFNELILKVKQFKNKMQFFQSIYQSHQPNSLLNQQHDCEVNKLKALQKMQTISKNVNQTQNHELEVIQALNNQRQLFSQLTIKKYQITNQINGLTEKKYLALEKSIQEKLFRQVNEVNNDQNTNQNTKNQRKRQNLEERHSQIMNMQVENLKKKYIKLKQNNLMVISLNNQMKAQEKNIQCQNKKINQIIAKTQQTISQLEQEVKQLENEKKQLKINKNKIN